VAVLGASVLIIAALGWQLLGPGATETVTPADAIAFDPHREDGENDADAPLAIDGDEATAWRTSTYENPDITVLKPGVGIVLDLGGRRTISGLRVTSPTPGWTAEVYVLDDVPGGPIVDEHDPVAAESGIDGDLDIGFAGREGAVVVLWITNTGAEKQVTVSEATVQVAA
jgi:putative peptidoglycan lipid II flippase